MKNTATFIACAALIYSGCKAQTGLKTKEVFMYKNGYTYVHKNGMVDLSDSRFIIRDEEVPQSIFGTVWLQSPQKVLNIQRYTDTLMKPVYQPSAEQMLKSSAGETVTLHMQTSSGVESISGKVIKVYEVPKGKTDVYSENPAIALLETGAGNVVIYRQTLRQVLFASFGSNTGSEVKERQTQPGLMIEFGTDKKSAELDFVYLEQRMSWAPSYRLKLNDSKGTLSLSAEISSGNLEMKGTRLNLVAGMPEVASGGMLSMLAGYREVDYRDYEAPSYEGAVENRAKVRYDGSGVETGNAEDYYVYTIQDFSLQKNQSALVNILEEAVKIEHTFTCDLYGVNEYVQPGTSSEPQLLPVFHQIEFPNPGKMPLTAAPVFVETSYSGGGELLLGQPVMESVPVGGKARIRVAQSLDIPLTQTEEESKRVSNAHFYKYGSTEVYFDLVTINAVIHVENQGNKEKTVKITRNIQGKPLKSDADWNIKTLPPQQSSPNSNSEVVWTVKLKPGEKRDISYSYEYYLRLY